MFKLPNIAKKSTTGFAYDIKGEDEHRKSKYSHNSGGNTLGSKLKLKSKYHIPDEIVKEPEKTAEDMTIELLKSLFSTTSNAPENNEDLSEHDFYKSMEAVEEKVEIEQPKFTQCGRIRFDFAIPDTTPQDLICEECEKRTAVLKCYGCRQLFCKICVDLAHPNIEVGTKQHQHITDKMIVPVEEGDESVIKPREFHRFLPPKAVDQWEMGVKVDLEQPNTLATAVFKNEDVPDPELDSEEEDPDAYFDTEIGAMRSPNKKKTELEYADPVAARELRRKKNRDLRLSNAKRPKKSVPLTDKQYKNACSGIFEPSYIPKTSPALYTTGEKLIFIDPVTGKEAFGRIVCEYDLRHGISAPTIIRGKDSHYYYVVEYINLVANVGGIEGLLKLMGRTVLADDEERKLKEDAEARALLEPKSAIVDVTAQKEKQGFMSRFPVIEGLTNISMRGALETARKLNHKLMQAKAIRIFGPRRHLLAAPYGAGPTGAGTAGAKDGFDNQFNYESRDGMDDGSDVGTVSHSESTAHASNPSTDVIDTLQKQLTSNEAVLVDNDFTEEDLQREAEMLLKTLPGASATQIMINAQRQQRADVNFQEKQLMKAITDTVLSSVTDVEMRKALRASTSSRVGTASRETPDESSNSIPNQVQGQTESPYLYPSMHPFVLQKAASMLEAEVNVRMSSGVSTRGGTRSGTGVGISVMGPTHSEVHSADDWGIRTASGATGYNNGFEPYGEQASRDGSGLNRSVTFEGDEGRQIPITIVTEGDELGMGNGFPFANSRGGRNESLDGLFPPGSSGRVGSAATTFRSPKVDSRVVISRSSHSSSVKLPGSSSSPTRVNQSRLGRYGGEYDNSTLEEQAQVPSLDEYNQMPVDFEFSVRNGASAGGAGNSGIRSEVNTPVREKRIVDGKLILDQSIARQTNPVSLGALAEDGVTAIPGELSLAQLLENKHSRIAGGFDPSKQGSRSGSRAASRSSSIGRVARSGGVGSVSPMRLSSAQKLLPGGRRAQMSQNMTGIAPLDIAGEDAQTDFMQNSGDFPFGNDESVPNSRIATGSGTISRSGFGFGFNGNIPMRFADDTENNNTDAMSHNNAVHYNNASSGTLRSSATPLIQSPAKLGFRGGGVRGGGSNSGITVRGEAEAGTLSQAPVVNTTTSNIIFKKGSYSHSGMNSKVHSRVGTSANSPSKLMSRSTSNLSGMLQDAEVYQFSGVNSRVASRAVSPYRSVNSSKRTHRPYNSDFSVAAEGHGTARARSRRSNEVEISNSTAIGFGVDAGKMAGNPKGDTYWDIACQQGTASAARGGTPTSTAQNMNTIKLSGTINYAAMPFHHHNEARDVVLDQTIGLAAGGLDGLGEKGSTECYYDHYGKPMFNDVAEAVKDTDTRSIIGSRTVGLVTPGGENNPLKTVGTTTGELVHSNHNYIYDNKPHSQANLRDRIHHSSRHNRNPAKSNAELTVRDGTAYGHGAIQKRVLLPEEELAIKNSHLSSNVATLRTYINALCKTSDDIKKLSKQQIYKRLQKLLVLSEADLCRPEDKQKLLLNHKFNFLRNFLDAKFFSIFKAMVKRGWTTWRNNMDHLKAVQQEYCARRIQTRARVWLCRNELDHQYDLYEEEMRKKHAKLHAQFHYSSKKNPYAVTFDNVMYFDTVAGCNRYCDLLRLTMNKCVGFLEKVKDAALKHAFKTWFDATRTFVESEMTTGHFEHQIRDQSSAAQKDFEGFKDEVAALHDKYNYGVKMIAKVGARAAAKYNPVPDDDFGYDNIANMPLNITRSPMMLANQINGDSSNVGASHSKSHMNSMPGTAPGINHSGAGAPGMGAGFGSTSISTGKEEPGVVYVPPYNPEDGIELPRLPLIYDASRDADARLNMTRQQRLEYRAYKANVEGPTDDSTWIIPGKLLMGKIPYGKARNNSSLDSISAIFLAGVNVFVSLMSAKEESDAQSAYLTKVKKETAENDAKMARFESLKFHVDVTPSVGEEQLEEKSEEKEQLEEEVGEQESDEEGSGEEEEEGDTGLSVGIGAGGLLDGLEADLDTQEEGEDGHAELLDNLGLSKKSKTPDKPNTAEAQQYSIRGLMQTLFANAKKSVDLVIIDCKTVISENEDKLRKIPIFSKEDPRYLKSKRERVRCGARIQRAKETMNRTTQQLSRIRESCEWMKCQLSPDSVPSIHDFLPTLWKLEKLLADGNCIYIYSNEGHGRVGMLAACLLGRLYGLSTYEALYRVQASHDCIPREFERKVSVQCPQLTIQRSLVSQVLNLTNRRYDGTIVRSHPDPETHRLAVVRKESGTAGGFANAPVITEPSSLLIENSSKPEQVKIKKLEKVKMARNEFLMQAGPNKSKQQRELEAAERMRKKMARAIEEEKASKEPKKEDVVEDPRDFDKTITQALTIHKQSLHLNAPVVDLLDAEKQAQIKVLYKSKDGYNNTSTAKQKAKNKLKNKTRKKATSDGKDKELLYESDHENENDLEKETPSIKHKTFQRSIDLQGYEDTMSVGQLKDVIRPLELQKYVPSEKPKLPLLRTRNET